MKNYITRRERGCSESSYSTWQMPEGDRSPRDEAPEDEYDWRRYSTCKQTTVINHPDCSRELYGFELRPICPKRPLKGEVVHTSFRVRGPRGLTLDYLETTWYPDGVIVRTNEYGVKTIWYPKPTLKDAVVGPREEGRYRYFRFNGDTVEAYFYGANYFWSADEFQSDFEKGEVTCGFLGEDGVVVWDNEDDCGCRNSYRCCGYDPADNGRD